MKSVLISINPKWCKLIADGKKTVEIRKTKPKLDVPFKCYIYATKSGDRIVLKNNKVLEISKALTGKVIGEFVCDKIDFWKHNWNKDVMHIEDMSNLSCVPIMDLMEYLDGIYDKNGNDKYLYAWHITALVIYDKPRKLSEFFKPLKYDNVDGAKVIHCGHYLDEEAVDFCEYNDGDCSLKGCKELRALYQITKPPQSWCYVEEAE